MRFDLYSLCIEEMILYLNLISSLRAAFGASLLTRMLESRHIIKFTSILLSSFLELKDVLFVIMTDANPTDG